MHYYANNSLLYIIKCFTYFYIIIFSSAMNEYSKPCFFEGGNLYSYSSTKTYKRQKLN